MNIPIQLIVAAIFLLLGLILAYKPWFQSREYLGEQKRRRSLRTKKNYPLPRALTIKIYERYPMLDLWAARVISLLFILICLAILLAPLF